MPLVGPWNRKKRRERERIGHEQPGAVLRGAQAEAAPAVSDYWASPAIRGRSRTSEPVSSLNELIQADGAGIFASPLVLIDSGAAP
jgi:hypothetical protein